MLGLGFLRRLSLETLKPDVSVVKGIVPVPVAEYLLNRKRKDLLELENRHNVTIVIEGSNDMIPGDGEIVKGNGHMAKAGAEGNEA
jgi:ribonuclease E